MISSDPDYVIRNREAWTKWSADYEVAGKPAWAKEEINWGIWAVPEKEIRALGDLKSLRGKDAVELGCGTAYFSAWLARVGMKPVGIDITPAQLQTARELQEVFDLTFPLVEGNAECTPFEDRSFDLVISEYGASIWCDPYKWVPEASRLLRHDGLLVFLRNSTISMICMPNEGAVKTELQRDYFGMHRFDWADDNSVEFHLPTGDMLRLLRANGFELEDFIELRAPEGATLKRFEYMTPEWARRWPSEEVWRLRKVR